MDSTNTALTGKSRQPSLGITLLQMNVELTQYYIYVKTGIRQETNTSYKFIPIAQHYNSHDGEALFCAQNNPQIQ
jgi:hypothetical protein